MDIYTLNIGQGQFVVVVGATEAVIVDTFVPLNPTVDVVNVKSALATILSGKTLIGLMVTGFDADHFNEVGIQIVLNKYRPNWIMYPKYFKETSTANACFAAIKTFESAKSFTRISVSLSANDVRFYGEKISQDFTFEIFSPHVADMNSSNNCSLVCKINERSTGATYLVSGDTEVDRWASIVRFFGSSLQADVLAAPHHGSRNGITLEAMAAIKPKVVLVSAGIGNSYGHPHAEATAIYSKHGKWFQTNYGEGQSLRTVVTRDDVHTYKFNP